MNRVILQGNLAKDPDIQTIQTGEKTVQVVNFVLATTRHFRKANGEKNQDTTFVPCEAWDSGAETIGQYCKKGDPLLVEGSLKTDSWEKDGQRISRMKVRVSSFQLLYRAPKPDNSTEQPEETA